MSDNHRLPPLNALRAFEAVVRLGSMARAADALAVTPGAVSQQVRLLESVVGVPLFRREGRQLVPTDTGLAAAALAGEAFDQLARAVALMRQPAKRDRLTVSVAPSFAGKWLAPRLFRFQEAHPELEVWVSADSAKVDLGRGAADLAIRYRPGDGPRGADPPASGRGALSAALTYWLDRRSRAPRRWRGRPSFTMPPRKAKWTARIGRRGFGVASLEVFPCGAGLALTSQPW